VERSSLARADSESLELAALDWSMDFELRMHVIHPGFSDGTKFWILIMVSFVNSKAFEVA
jgi:hypothetical protein